MKEVHFEIDLQISRIDKESVGHVRGELGRSERCCKKQPVHMRSSLSRQRNRAHFSRLGRTCHKRTHLGSLGEIHQRDRYREKSGSSQSGERPSIAAIDICWRYLEVLETGQNT